MFGEARLDQPPQVVDLVDLIQVQHGHERAPPWYGAQQALTDQRAHGLPQRDAAHPEAVGEFLLDEAVSRRIDALDDQSAQFTREGVRTKGVTAKYSVSSTHIQCIHWIQRALKGLRPRFTRS